MAIIRGAGQHHIHAVNLPGKQNAVPIKRQEGILQLMEGFKILRPGNTDGGAVIAIAPGNIILIFQLGNAGVIAILVPGNLRIGAYQIEGFIINLPMKAILAAAGKNIHADGFAVTAEYAGKCILERNNGTVEHAVGALVAVAPDDRIAGITPNRIGIPSGLFFPRNIRQRLANNLCHRYHSLSYALM